jgi:hypothetical protein
MALAVAEAVLDAAAFQPSQRQEWRVRAPQTSARAPQRSLLSVDGDALPLLNLVGVVLSADRFVRLSPIPASIFVPPRV